MVLPVVPRRPTHGDQTNQTDRDTRLNGWVRRCCLLFQGLFRDSPGGRERDDHSAKRMSMGLLCGTSDNQHEEERTPLLERAERAVLQSLVEHDLSVLPDNRTRMRSRKGWRKDTRGRTYTNTEQANVTGDVSVGPTHLHRRNRTLDKSVCFVH